MSAKKCTEVLIDGKVYTLSGYEEEDYLQKVATYINNKISQVKDFEGFSKFPPDMQSAMVELNIADDYFKAKDLVEKYERDLEEKDREIYNLKHDLISDQIKVENLEESVRTSEKRIKELESQKEKLQASLEEALLGDMK